MAALAHSVPDKFSAIPAGAPAAEQTGSRKRQPLLAVARRIRQRRALAQLSQRELADFGASTADVYWELARRSGARRRPADCQPDNRGGPRNEPRLNDLPHIDAPAELPGADGRRPRNYTFDPPPGVPRSNTMHEAHTVPIHDARAVAGDISLDREGFARDAPQERGAGLLGRGRDAPGLLSGGAAHDRRGDRRRARCSSSTIRCAAA